MAEVRGQRIENRGQNIEDRGQRTEGRRQKIPRGNKKYGAASSGKLCENR